MGLTYVVRRGWLLMLPLLLVTITFAQSDQGEVDKSKHAYNRGVTAMQEGKDVEAIEAFKAAIEADENYSDAYLNLGVIYYGQREYDQALEMFKSAAEKDPQSIDAFTNLGRVQTALNKYAEAEASLKAAVAIDENNGESHQELGTFYYKRKNWEQAVVSLEKCHNLGGGDHLTWVLLGKSLQKQNKINEAIAALEKSVGLKSSNYQAHSALGQIYLAQDNYLKAAREFDAALKADPKRWRASFNYASAMEWSDPEATDANIANWESFIKMAKNIPKAKTQVATARQHVKELKEKKEHEELN